MRPNSNLTEGGEINKTIFKHHRKKNKMNSQENAPQEETPAQKGAPYIDWKKIIEDLYPKEKKKREDMTFQELMEEMHKVRAKDLQPDLKPVEIGQQQAVPNASEQEVVSAEVSEVIDLSVSSFPSRASEPSALDAFGLEPSEIDQLTRGDADGFKAICLCGHGVSRHVYTSTTDFQCMVAKGWCGCKHVKPVVKVKDTRTFMFTTTGYGPKHALIRGIRAYEIKGQVVRFIRKPSCVACNREDGPLHPASLNLYNKVSMYPSERNFILCYECLQTVL